jgi:hypothetical protein
MLSALLVVCGRELTNILPEEEIEEIKQAIFYGQNTQNLIDIAGRHNWEHAKAQAKIKIKQHASAEPLHKRAKLPQLAQTECVSNCNAPGILLNCGVCRFAALQEQQVEKQHTSEHQHLRDLSQTQSRENVGIDEASEAVVEAGAAQNIEHPPSRRQSLIYM